MPDVSGTTLNSSTEQFDAPAAPDTSGPAILVPWYAREDYSAVREVMEDGDTLPVNYDEWLTQAERFLARLSRGGMGIVRVKLDSHAFRSWCQERGLKPNPHGRTQYTHERAKNALCDRNGPRF